LPKYKIKKSLECPIFFVAKNLEKNILTPENQLFSANQERKKKKEKKPEKKNFRQSYTPCLNSQSVKIDL